MRAQLVEMQLLWAHGGSSVQSNLASLSLATPHQSFPQNHFPSMSFTPSTSSTYHSRPNNQSSSPYHYYLPELASTMSNLTASEDNGEYSQLVPSVHTQSCKALLAFSSSSISRLSSNNSQLSLGSSGYPQGFDTQELVSTATSLLFAALYPRYIFPVFTTLSEL